MFWIWMHYNFRKSSWQLEKFSKNNCCHHYNILSLLNLMNRNQFISKCGLTINNNKFYFIFTPFCLDDFILKSSRTRISFWLIYVFWNTTKMNQKLSRSTLWHNCKSKGRGENSDGSHLGKNVFEAAFPSSIFISKTFENIFWDYVAALNDHYFYSWIL